MDKLVRDRLIRGGVHWRGNLVWTIKSTGKQVSTCGYEFDTVNPSDAWLRLTYKVKGTEEQINYRLNLTTTKPLYGGLRWWMVCPLSIEGKVCRRRVGRLYLPPGGKYFGCRQCYGLTYTSCQESHKFDRVFNEMARSFPGTTGKEIRQLLESRW